MMKNIMSRLRTAWLAWVMRLAHRAYIYAALRQSVFSDRADLAKLLERELLAIPETVAAHFAYQDREVRILTDRLSRRFDVGSAVNEAANRAIQDKKVAREAQPLTGRQLAALEFQKQHLQKIVDRS